MNRKPISKSAVLGLMGIVNGLLLGTGEPRLAERPPSRNPACPRCGGRVSARGRTAYCLKHRCGWFEVSPAK